MLRALVALVNDLCLVCRQAVHDLLAQLALGYLKLSGLLSH